MDGIPQWADFIAHIGAGLGAVAILIAFGRKIFKWICNFTHEVVFMFRQRAVHNQIDGKLDRILSEVTTNNGSSIKDAVNRIENHLDFLGSFRRAQMNTNKIALCETDSGGNLTWANRRYCKMLGVSEKDVLGKGWINVIEKDARPWVEESFLRAVSEKREWNEDVPHICANGKTCTIHVICHPIMADDGSLFGYLAELHPDQSCEYHSA